jgi:hypothetical protein
MRTSILGSFAFAFASAMAVSALAQQPATLTGRCNRINRRRRKQIKVSRLATQVLRGL